MTKNVEAENICSRLERLVAEYEQAREPESTEIGQQFAVSSTRTIPSSYGWSIRSSNYNER